jgi:hypothetical protein
MAVAGQVMSKYPTPHGYRVRQREEPGAGVSVW